MVLVPLLSSLSSSLLWSAPSSLHHIMFNYLLSSDIAMAGNTCRYGNNDVNYYWSIASHISITLVTNPAYYRNSSKRRSEMYHSPLSSSFINIINRHHHVRSVRIIDGSAKHADPGMIDAIAAMIIRNHNTITSFNGDASASILEAFSRCASLTSFHIPYMGRRGDDHTCCMYACVSTIFITWMS